MTLFRKKYYTYSFKRNGKLYKVVIKFPINVESYFADEQVKTYKSELKKLVEYLVRIEEIKSKLPFEVEKVVEVKF